MYSPNQPPRAPQPSEPSQPPSQPSSQPPARIPIPTVRPRLTYVFLAINIIIFVVTLVTGRRADPSSSPIWLSGANIPVLVAAGEYWRLFTANWLHASTLHIAFNAYALYALGRQVEAVYGYPRFTTVYLLSGIAGAVFSYVLTRDPQVPSVGASTSLFGLFGALVVYFYKNRRIFGEIGRQQLINLGITLLVNVFLGLTPGSNIDNAGHAGGFIGGLALAWFLCPRYAPTDPMVHAFGSVVSLQRKPELANAYMADNNSLLQQALPVTLFAVALAALTAFVTSLRQ